MKLFAQGLIGLSVLAAGAVHAEDKSKSAVTFAPSLTVSTDGTTKGISETDGNGQAILGLQASTKHFYAGVRFKNVKTAEGGDSQTQYTVGAKTEAAGLNLNFQIWNKVTNGTVAGTDNAFIEYQVDVSKTFNNKKTTVKLLNLYSPDAYAKTKEANWTEFTVTQKVTPKLVLSGGIGSRTATPKKDYTAYNVGGTYALTSKTSVDFRYLDTDKHTFGKKYENRFVMTVTKKF